jgi:hypothetical protein
LAQLSVNKPGARLGAAAHNLLPLENSAMSTSATDFVALEALLARQAPQSGDGGSAEIPAEHPLARELRSVLANPQAHRIADLARLVNSIRREMTMFKAGTETDFDAVG